MLIYKETILIDKIKQILTVEIPFWVFALCFLALVVVVNIDTDDGNVIQQEKVTQIKLAGPDGETLFSFEISEPSTDDDDE